MRLHRHKPAQFRISKTEQETYEEGRKAGIVLAMIVLALWFAAAFWLMSYK